jgi:hypothetical protein
LWLWVQWSWVRGFVLELSTRALRRKAIHESSDASSSYRDTFKFGACDNNITWP